MRSVLGQGIVDAILLVIAHIFTDQAAKVIFVERDDMIEQFPAATSNPSFGGSVLPRRLTARPLWLQTRRLQEGDDAGVEDRIAVQDGIPIGSRFRKRLARRTTQSADGCCVTCGSCSDRFGPAGLKRY